VAAMWQESGMLGNMAFTATEQSPKDVYMIDVFDLDRERPRQCVKNDPDLPYC